VTDREATKARLSGLVDKPVKDLQLARTWRARRVVVGVEISPTLSAIAKRNLHEPGAEDGR